MAERRRKKRKINTKGKIICGILIVALIAGGIGLKKYIDNNALKKQGEILSVEENKDPLDNEGQTATTILAEDVSISAINVGDGLSVFVNAGGKTLLYDAGSKENGKTVVDTIKKLDPAIKKIDYIIASHNDSEHIGGFKSVFSSFNIGTTIYGEDSSELKKIAKEKSEVYKEDEDESFSLADNVTVSVIDVKDGDKNSKNNSVCVLIQMGKTNCLITGDIDKATEKILNGKIPEDINLYIGGDHGSSDANYLINTTSVNYQFDYYVLSCKENTANSQVKELILEKAALYETSSGTKTFISDGEQILPESELE